MEYRVELVKRAKKQLNNIPKNFQHKVQKALLFLTIDPEKGKSLEAEFRGCYAARAWPYRIIYEVSTKEKKVTVLLIKHRKDVYR